MRYLDYSWQQLLSTFIIPCLRKQFSKKVEAKYATSEVAGTQTRQVTPSFLIVKHILIGHWMFVNKKPAGVRHSFGTKASGATFSGTPILRSR